MTSGSIWGKQQIVLRAPSRARPAILAIGSSTGGPQALFKLLATLSPDLNLPVVITQHMPATFTAILAEHIQNATKRACKEAVSGEPLVSGQIYVAPGDYHMTIVAEGSNRVLRLNQEPPENFCRPAVDPMFRSIAKIYGNAALAVILTGMGTDGREGGRVLVDAGGTLVCQDEASSVVWGMPGAAATAGLAAAVVSLDQMPATISRFIKGGM
jgi:two-component system chemotaxis response regulator CheB